MAEQTAGTFYLTYRDPRGKTLIRVEVFEDVARHEAESRAYELRDAGVAVKESYRGSCSFCVRHIVDSDGLSMCRVCRAPLDAAGEVNCVESLRPASLSRSRAECTRFSEIREPAAASSREESDTASRERQPRDAQVA